MLTESVDLQRVSYDQTVPFRLKVWRQATRTKRGNNRSGNKDSAEPEV